nr:uncharacterized protein LOC109182299 [Ipomoea trifida]
MAAKQEPKVSLKLLIDEKTNRLVGAEAHKDFVDILFSFLTLPMATVIRVTKSVTIGCMNNLYHSIQNIGAENWHTVHCKTMVLNPRNPLANYCKKLKMNVDDSGSEKKYGCSHGCKSFSMYQNVKCYCSHGWTTKEMKSDDSGSVMNCSYEGVFLQKGWIVFLISDDLQIRPASPNVLDQLISGLGLSEMNQIKEIPVEVSKEQVICLLARSLVSKSPLSDVFLPNHGATSINANPERILPSSTHQKTHTLNLNVKVNKHTNDILFAEATNEFFDFLCSFLTIPIGTMISVLGGNSGLGCIDNLYGSLAELDVKWFGSADVKSDILLPGIATHHNCTMQPLNLIERQGVYNMVNPKNNYCSNFSVEPSVFIVSRDLEVKPLSFASSFVVLRDAKVALSDTEDQVIAVGTVLTEGGSYIAIISFNQWLQLLRDLVVKPLSFASSFVVLRDAKVPLSDTEDRVITALCLLKAALKWPSSALANGLNTFVQILFYFQSSPYQLNVFGDHIAFNMADKQESSVSLKLFIDEETDGLVIAEAPMEFVDILFSFLSFPMGTIIRITSSGQVKNPITIGCMNNLYQSIQNLSSEYWDTEYCKIMVLNPRNPLAYFSKKLKMNIDDSESEMKYECSCPNCKYFSSYQNVCCSCNCGRTTRAIKPAMNCTYEGAFLQKGRIMFLITDDLQVGPASPDVLAQFLSNFDLSEMKQIREITIEVSKEQVICLLARSFVSKTPLSDVFRPNQQAKPERTFLSSPVCEIQTTDQDAPSFNLKVKVNKHTNKIVYAEATDEFFDFLCSFLTIPIGTMVRILKENSGLGCLHNLYTSVEKLDNKWFGSSSKFYILDPMIAPHHNCKKQPLELLERKGEFGLINPRPRNRFSLEPSVFLVSGDLEVMPLSFASSFLVLRELEVPFSDIEEQVVAIGIELIEGRSNISVISSNQWLKLLLAKAKCIVSDPMKIVGLQRLGS